MKLRRKNEVAKKDRRVFEIEKLCTIRRDPLSRKKEVLVSWKGYKASEASWEKYDDLIEDGLESQIKALEKSLSGSERYLLNIRFRNVKEHSGLYKDFSSFLQDIGYLDEDQHHHIRGGSELILKLADVKEFAIDLRSFLKKHWIECEHATLYKIEAIITGICCLYPAID